MQNLEQIRARHALDLSQTGALKGKDGGDIIKKIPSLIINHGLLATCAFSYSENKDDWGKVFDAIASHLADEAIGVLPQNVQTRDSMMDFLSGAQSDSETLKRATHEAMAWLCYARRFVKKGDGKEKRS